MIAERLEKIAEGKFLELIILVAALIIIGWLEGRRWRW